MRLTVRLLTNYMESLLGLTNTKRGCRKASPFYFYDKDRTISVRTTRLRCYRYLNRGGLKEVGQGGGCSRGA